MKKVRKHPHAGLAGARRDFVALVSELCRADGRRHSDVLGDFLELSYCALAKKTHPVGSGRAEELEARYVRLVGKRTAEYVRKMPKLLGMLAVGLERDGGDFLGSVAGELGALHGGLGQYFTPYEVSLAIAEMALAGIEEVVAEKGYFTVAEPACGAGGMLLAVAEVVASKGLDPSRCMLATAQDLSHAAYQMAYVQLSLRGVPATVIRGNSLALEVLESERTFAWLRFPHSAARGEG